MRDVWIHIHIPKCGGSTFEGILKRNFGNGYRTTNSILNNYWYNDHQILQILNAFPSLTCLAGHKISLNLPYTESGFRLIVSCFVRNPVDRFLSAYYFHRSHQVTNHKSQAREMNIEDYIHWTYEEANFKMSKNGQVKYLIGNRDIEENESYVDHIFSVAEENNVMLFPLDMFDEALALMSAIYPDYLRNLNYQREKISLKDQIISSEQTEKLLDMNYLDFLLYQKAVEMTRNLIMRSFEDRHVFEKRVEMVKTANSS